MNLAGGTYSARSGLVACTDRRILFVCETLTRHVLEDFPYERISSVQTERSLLSGKIMIFASGNRAEIVNVMPKGNASEIGDYVRGRIQQQSGEPAASHVPPHPPPPPPAPPPKASTPDTALPSERLQQLIGLLEQGLISADEYEAKRREIIANL